MRVASIVAAVAAGVASGGGVGCLVPGTFACEEDSQCVRDGTVGACVEGGCSFPDGDCASGSRYSEFAGDDRGGACVDPGADASASGSSTDDGSNGEDASPAARTPTDYACGNGLHEPGEDCDDGNAMNADGCNVDCVLSGSTLWQVSFDAGEDDRAYGVDLGGGGEVAVAGRISEGSGDLWIGVWTPDGEPAWSESFPNPAHADEAHDVAVLDADTYVLAGVYEPNATNGQDQWLGAYEPTGDGGATLVWKRTINSNDNEDDQYEDVFATPAGELVAVGHVRAPDGTETVVRGYDAAGTLLWQFYAGITTTEPDEANAVRVDADGRIFTTGYTKEAGKAQAWVTEFATDQIVWTFGNIGVAGEGDNGHAITFDPAGDLVVAGRLAYRTWLGGFTRDGDPSWSRDEQLEGDAEYLGVAVDATGDILAVGYVTGANDDEDAIVDRYGPAPDLVRRWSVRHDGGVGGDDRARDIAIDQDGTIVVVGFEEVAGQGHNAWIEKYAP